MGRKWIYPDAERRSLRRVRTIAEGKCRDLCIYFLLYICCTRCRAGLHCGMGCSRAVGEQGSALAVARPSPCLVEGVSARGARAAERRLTRCSPRPQLPRFPWDLPGSGVEPVSPAWAAGRRLPASSGGTNRELCSMSRGSRDGRGVWGSMGTCTWMAESPCCPPEAITPLSISYSVRFSSAAESCPTLCDPRGLWHAGLPGPGWTPGQSKTLTIKRRLARSRSWASVIRLPPNPGSLHSGG